MNYLSICDISSIQKTDDSFIGVIEPANYSDWRMVPLFILLLEGAHQFSVKIILKSDSNINILNNSHKMVPVQIRKLKSYKSAVKSQKYFIKGRFIEFSNIYIVDFAVFDDNNFAYDKRYFDGQIYVSAISV